MKRVIIPLLIAAFLWFFMFSPWTNGIFNFWTAMSFSAIVLMNMAFALRPQWWVEDVKFDWKNIAGGVALAVVLWGVFWVGDKASAWLFDFARSAGGTYLRDEDWRKPLVAFRLATYTDRTCGRNLLAGLCAECAFQTLEPECRIYSYDTGLCTGAHLVIQFYAGNGCIGGRWHLGLGLQAVST